MYIIGGFDYGVRFCSIEAYEESGMILVGEDRLYDTERKIFISVVSHYIEEELDDMPF